MSICNWISISIIAYTLFKTSTSKSILSSKNAAEIAKLMGEDLAKVETKLEDNDESIYDMINEIEGIGSLKYLAHSQSTSFQGIISCNSVVSGTINNYDFHAYKIIERGNGCKISADFQLSNKRSSVGFFNSKGKSMGQSSVVLSNQYDSVYYIQLKGDNTYKFRLKCNKKCASKRRLLDVS
eukprot:241692_1